MTSKEYREMRQRITIIYPNGNDDWSAVDTLILGTAKYWLGQYRLVAKSVRRGGDLSLLPVSARDPDGWPEDTAVWTNDDEFEDLLASPNGQTIATHMAGSGLRPEYVSSELGADIEHEIWALMERKNPGIDDISDDADAYQWVLEEATRILDEYRNCTIGQVIADLKGA